MNQGKAMTTRNGIDVLMITYNRPVYTRLALSELLDRSQPDTRVWVWHNGSDPETLAVVESFRPRLHRFHHSVENVRLTKPINWLFENAQGAYLSKVDDDCIVPEAWDVKLVRRAQAAGESLGGRIRVPAEAGLHRQAGAAARRAQLS
jgi:glycosyltransferase involved in cell wall biosynthesis